MGPDKDCTAGPEGRSGAVFKREDRMYPGGDPVAVCFERALEVEAKTAVCIRESIPIYAHGLHIGFPAEVSSH